MGAGVVEVRIAEAERYLLLLERNCGSEWLLLRDDALARSDLALALSLIHPEVWNQNAHPRNVQGPRAFMTNNMYGTRMCDAKRYWGVECTVDTEIDGVAADHSWPYGLGGPTTTGNIRWLCTRHNQMKSVDIHLYPWEQEWPEWLMPQLERVRAHVN